MSQTSSKIETIEDIAPAHEREGQKPSRLQRIPQRLAIAVLIFATALGFDLYRLGNPSIWFDEAFSIELARQPLPLLWHIIWGPEPNMELYYLFLHFWLGFTSFLGLNPTEFVVRFPSAIFAALSAVVVFFLGQRFMSMPAGIVAAALYLLNDLQMVYAQQTRSYSLQLLLTCIAWYALLVALTCQSHPKRWWTCYVVATVLAIYAHLFSLLILLAQLIAVAVLLLLPNSWRSSTRKQVRAFGVSLLATSVLIIPIVLESRQEAKTGWLTIPHLGDLLNLFRTISGPSKWYLLAIAACCAVGVLGVVMGALLGGREGTIKQAPTKGSYTDNLLSAKQYFPVMLAWLCWLVIPIGVSYVLSHGAIHLFSPRYLVTIVPPLFLLVALAVAVLRWRVVQVALAVALIGLSLSTVPLYYRSAQVEDWNSTSHWLIQHYQSGDGLVCYDNNVQQGCQISVQYYLDAYPSAAHFTDDAPGAFSWTNFGPTDAATGFDAAVDPTVLATYGAKHPRLFFVVGRLPDDKAAAKAQAARQWLDSHYRFVDQIVTRSVTIRLYMTDIGAHS